MDSYEKVENKLKVTKIVEEYYDINSIKEEIESYEKNILYLQSKINSLNVKLNEADKLGLKPINNQLN